jgi:phage head maturation protease
MRVLGIGGLYVKAKYAMDTTEGREAFNLCRFLGDACEFSIGYRVVESEYSRELQANLLKEIDLWEFSCVAYGANDATALVSAKSASKEAMVPIPADLWREVMAELVRDDVRVGHGELKYPADVWQALLTAELLAAD